MLFWRKIHFVVIYALLCRAKLTQTSCLWSKSAKYHVCGSSCALFRLHTDANSILLHHLLPPPPPLTLPLPLQLPLPPPPLLLLPLRFYLFNNPQIELCKHIVINSCSCRGYLSKQGTRLKGWNRWWWCRWWWWWWWWCWWWWWSNVLHRNIYVWHFATLEEEPRRGIKKSKQVKFSFQALVCLWPEQADPCLLCRQVRGVKSFLRFQLFRKNLHLFIFSIATRANYICSYILN